MFVYWACHWLSHLLSTVNLMVLGNHDTRHWQHGVESQEKKKKTVQNPFFSPLRQGVYITLADLELTMPTALPPSAEVKSMRYHAYACECSACVCMDVCCMHQQCSWGSHEGAQSPKPLSSSRTQFLKLWVAILFLYGVAYLKWGGRSLKKMTTVIGF